MGLISGCRYLKVNLKAKMYPYVNSTFQRCPNKIIKIFLIGGLSTCTCLDFRGFDAPGHVYTTGARAAPGLVRAKVACADLGRVYTTVA